MLNNRIAKILIVDDHAIVKAGLEFLLRRMYSSVEIFYATDFSEALSFLRKNQFDLIILDIDIPGGNNTGMMSTLRIKDPNVPILIYTGFSERIYGVAYMQTGAHGYLSKSSSEEELENAIRIVMKGKKYMSATLQQSLLDFIVHNTSEDPVDIHSLTRREIQVAELLVKGSSTAQIAETLGLQLSTVSTFKSKIYVKMQVNNLVELINKMKIRP